MKILNKDLDDYVLGKATDEKKKLIEELLIEDKGILKDKIADINILQFVSNLLISKDIISLTNNWKKSWSKDKIDQISDFNVLSKRKSEFTSKKNVWIFVIISMILLFIWVGLHMWQGQKEKAIVNEPIADIFSKNQQDETTESKELIFAEEDIPEKNEKLKFKTKNTSNKNKYKQTAMAMLPNAKVERLRDDSKNSFGEKVYQFYANDDLNALLSIQNDFDTKGVTNEYLADLIGRLWIKRGDIGKAMIIYTELSQIDSPNVDEYEFLLLLTYYADFPSSKYNFSQLQKYIAADSFHTYFREVEKLTIN